jgi:DnaJ-class molecular chaperone
MDIQKALEILECDNANITLPSLKKQYYKLALRNHPDKNGNTLESTQRFQQINDAYDILKREIEDDDGASHNDKTTMFSYMANLFVDGLMKNEYISSIIKNIISDGYSTISRKVFDNLDKEQATSIYNFMFKYKTFLHIDEELLDKIKNIILEKYKNVQIYILNPSLTDIIENNIYKLEIDGQTYYVPLWHSEVYFDDPNNNEIIVKCIPDLPDNMSIDENNNLYITLPDISFTFSLLKDEYIVILIGKRSINLPICKLLCKPVQTYTFKGNGISQIIDTVDMIYNTDIRGDIIVKIKFV